ncbi:MAG: hypothetical protein FRX48_05623 [Lasallia pustulata]|uniref:Uncharacterized protein n=1 Tax=Lasallia pustulata TaxID=136370 RepID=A0A1W5D658_9LECA|nr:MAG: hypothetical protein FRX48_05623 [Lasallia pustulata]SLM38511.1 hypothetical protein LPUS_08743 [Lasallia pustulata]
MNAPAGGQGGDGRDYLDKALEAAEKKFGGARFSGPDAAGKNRAMNEKITDGIRKMIEKVTGRKMPAKYSN